jgi:hypothetical protein
VTVPEGSVPWAWLAACRKCGKAHEYRQETCGCGKEAKQGSFTWASPDDGHSYESRLSAWQLEQLVAEYQADIAAERSTPW